MKTKISIMTKLVLVLLTLSTVSFALPEGWYKAGSNPESYHMDIDTNVRRANKGVFTIKSIDAKIEGFGTLMRNDSPDKYLGKRVRMTGYMKTLDVSEWAGLWFRVDQKGSQVRLGFDNMHDGKEDRSIRGTTSWKKYEIILDVPKNASNLAYGALLVGTGQIWFDSIEFEIVDNTIPTTGY